MTTRNQGLRSEAVRETNLLTILQRLHLHGPVSRSDIGRETGLTRSAVGTLVSHLTSQGFTREVRAESDGTRGRPSPLVHPESNNVVLAVEILVDSISVAAVGLGGPILRSTRRDRPRDQTPIERTVKDVATLVESITSSLESDAAVLAMGVAVPGLVRTDDHLVVTAPNLHWHDAPLRELLAQKLPFDVPILVGNEANLAALAESRRGSAEGLDDVVLLSGEVGVGGGVLAGRQLLTGTSGFAGEIGHLPLNVNGIKCNCGAVGCLETEVGEEALLRRAGLPIDSGRAGLNQLFEAASNGDTKTLAALEEHGRWLGFGVAGLVNIFNPHAVVFGGFLGTALPFVRQAVQGELDQRVLNAILSDTQLFAASLGIDAPLVGAAELAWNHALVSMVHESVSS